MLPRCGSVGAVLEAGTPLQALARFGEAALEAVAAIFTESYISLVALLSMFVLAFGFARSGGVGE